MHINGLQTDQTIGSSILESRRIERHQSPSIPVKSIDGTEGNPRPPLFTAAVNGDLLKVEELLNRGESTEPERNYHHSLPYCAALSGNMGVVNFLANRGISDIEQEQSIAGTSLHAAVISGNSELVDNLITRGANSNAIHEGHSARTPLHFAAVENNVAIIRSLIDAGADVNALDSNGHSALDLAALQKNSNEACDALIEAGADPKQSNPRMIPAIHAAVLQGNKADFEYWLSKGADPKLKTIEGMTLLHSAVYGENLEIIKELIEQGLDVNAADNTGTSVLGAAIEVDDKAITDYLINDAGADPWAEDLSHHNLGFVGT
jgi:ankyrin repeat protein